MLTLYLNVIFFSSQVVDAGEEEEEEEGRIQNGRSVQRTDGRIGPAEAVSRD